MESLLLGSFLIMVGIFLITVGYMFFRILLPFLGFIVGFSIGFGGIQAIFGSNVASYFAAMITAFLLGVVLALLAYTYYTFAVIVLGASLLASIFAFFGQVIGLREDGFIVFMLSVTGAIIGALAVIRNGLQHSLIVYFTSFYGVGLILLAAFLIVGDATTGTLHETGVTGSISEVVSSSWIWFLAWVGGGMFATYFQMSLIARAMYESSYIIEEANKSKK